MKKFIVLLSVIYFLILTEDGRVSLIKCSIHTINFFMPRFNIQASDISSPDIKKYNFKKLHIKLNSYNTIQALNLSIKLGKISYVGANSVDIDLNYNKASKNLEIDNQQYDINSLIRKYHQIFYFLHKKIDIIVPKIQINSKNKKYLGTVNFEHTPFENYQGKSFISLREDDNFSLYYESMYYTKINRDFVLDFNLDINYLRNQIKIKSKYETNYHSKEFTLKKLDVFHNQNKIIEGKIIFLEKNLKANFDINKLDIDHLLGRPVLKQEGLIISAKLQHEGQLSLGNIKGELVAWIKKDKYLLKIKNENSNVLNVKTYFNDSLIGFINASINKDKLLISTKLKETHNLFNSFITAQNSNFEADVIYYFDNNKWQIEKCDLEVQKFKFKNFDLLTFDKFTAELVLEENKIKLISLIEDTKNSIKLSGSSFIQDNTWDHDYTVKTDKFVLSNKSSIHIPINGELQISGRDKDLSITGEIGINSSKIKQMDLINFSSIPKIKIASTKNEESNNIKINSNIIIKINETLTIESDNFIVVLKGKATITRDIFNPEIVSELSISDGYYDVLNKKFIFKTSQIFSANNNIYLLMVAHYTDSEYEYIIEISGELGQNLVVNFSSIPSMPKSKIIPRLILGKNLEKISPFEAILLLQKVLNIKSNTNIDHYLNIFKLEDFKVTQEEGALKIKMGKKISDKVSINLEGGSNERIEKVISIERIFSKKLSGYLKSSTKKAITLGAKLNRFYD